MRRERGSVDDIATVAKGIPEVQVVYTTAGDPDALALLRVRDVDDLKRVIDRLRSTGVVVGTKTLMVLGHRRRTADRRAPGLTCAPR
jgi:Lrp/AsnC family leucine-responsive transcriptional regulator